ncbi:sodium:solute symporter family transporter [Marinobacterium sp. YM272]|uniref:sodium:solute symporter family transporter n=1 Tax=Marinobacterium sp. YM272 TaxID=3421654 RepID=UPI003D7F7E40
MFSTSLVIVTLTLYMAFLFIAAQVAEKRPVGRSVFTPYVYALSLTVYFTSWGFYGNVGFAAESGLLYLGTEIGSVLAIIFWWYTIKRIVRVKERYRITNIADFISARYNRSQTVAALVTLTALCGVVPYIALQLKAIVATISIVLPLPEEDWSGMGLIMMLAMVLFTVLFGARRLDPTERHPGVLVVLALQGLVKLGAILAIGIFITYVQYDGFGALFDRIEAAGLDHLTSASNPTGSLTAEWMALIILGMVAVQCLPRQFHLLVVENSHERDIVKAVWLFLIYYLVFDLFVIPIAAAGLLQGLPPEQADEFVLLLPHIAGESWLTLLVFIGGFSAASGMIIISTMTLSTMLTNHLMLPVIEEVRAFNFLRHYLLQLRWLLIALIIFCSYLVAWIFSDSYMLIAMGTFAFVAVIQFAPPMFGGIFWRRANRYGAVAGLLAGLLTWFYTLVIPALVRQGWGADEILIYGPWQISWLKPEALLEIDTLSPLSHSVFWSLGLNLLFFIAGSWLHSPGKEERMQLVEFFRALAGGGQIHSGRPAGLEAYIPFPERRREAVRLLGRYLPEHKAAYEVDQIVSLLQGQEKDSITIIELVEFHRLLEARLSGAIGAASAHRVVECCVGYSDREKRDLKALYSHILTELGSSEAADRAARQASEGGGEYSFISELQERIELQKKEIEKHRAELASLKSKFEQCDAELFEQRVANQRLIQELKDIHKQIDGDR